MEFIETPMCTVCGATTLMYVDEIAYSRWQSREILIQQAFPEMTSGERELLKQGSILRVGIHYLLRRNNE